jgi:hypothetical protein
VGQWEIFRKHTGIGVKHAKKEPPIIPKDLADEVDRPE